MENNSELIIKILFILKTFILTYFNYILLAFSIRAIYCYVFMLKHSKVCKKVIFLFYPNCFKENLWIIKTKRGLFLSITVCLLSMLNVYFLFMNDGFNSFFDYTIMSLCTLTNYYAWINHKSLSKEFKEIRCYTLESDSILLYSEYLQLSRMAIIASTLYWIGTIQWLIENHAADIGTYENLMWNLTEAMLFMTIFKGVCVHRIVIKKIKDGEL